LQRKISVKSWSMKKSLMKIETLTLSLLLWHNIKMHSTQTMYTIAIIIIIILSVCQEMHNKACSLTSTHSMIAHINPRRSFYVAFMTWIFPHLSQFYYVCISLHFLLFLLLVSHFSLARRCESQTALPNVLLAMVYWWN
jgi:hypothetical protein